MNQSVPEKKRTLIKETYSQYLNYLLEGRAQEAQTIIEHGLSNGLALRSMYMDIILPAQVEIGELWHKDEIAISVEHLATQIALDQLSYLRQRIRPKESLGYKVVISTVTEETHSFGARVVADFLFMDGFEIYFLGINTPGKELARFSLEKQADIVGISVTMEKNVIHVEDALKEIRALHNPPKIIIGGPKELTHWKAIKSLAPDAIATDATAAVAACRKVLGLPGSSRSLAQYLHGLGGRIQVSRRALNMSQQELADSSGLDRAYISSLENGKQNVTVGAVLKIAEALDIPIEDILIGA